MKIIEDAKTIVQNMLLEIGYLTPFILAEGTTSRNLIPIDDLPAIAEGRVAAVFNIGSDMATQKSVGMLKTVVCVSQGKLFRSYEKPRPGFRLSSDPHKKEVILIIALHVDANKQESLTFQIVSDAQGNFSRIEPFDVSGEPFSPLLPAFVRGYTTAVLRAGRQ